ncbi:hypothetical protein BDQ17DRAFT_108107 [Cyathus striatus]|nr:hypothetical protein BDQ17DRAFT_108107 [Cyathus striatus]
MHTTSYGGINTGRTEILTNEFSVPTPFTVGYENADMEDLNDYTLDGLEAEFEVLERAGFTSESGDGLSAAVPVEDIYNIHLINAIHAGHLPSIQPEVAAADRSGNEETSWDTRSLLHAMGLD